MEKPATSQEKISPNLESYSDGSNANSALLPGQLDDEFVCTSCRYCHGSIPEPNLQLWHMRFHSISACIIAALLTLLLVVHRTNSGGFVSGRTASLPADFAFGEIPEHTVVFEEDSRFVDTDLFNLHYNGTAKESAWDEFHLIDGFWIELQTSAQAGVKGGLPPRLYHGDVSSASEAFVPAIHHQLHCVIILKATLQGIYEGPQYSKEHTDHCIEYIRQALVCKADVTLEPPAFVGEVKGWRGPTGWGVAHSCRDWSYIYDFISKHAIPQSALLPNQ